MRSGDSSMRIQPSNPHAMSLTGVYCVHKLNSPETIFSFQNLLDMENIGNLQRRKVRPKSPSQIHKMLNITSS